MRKLALINQYIVAAGLTWTMITFIKLDDLNNFIFSCANTILMLWMMSYWHRELIEQDSDLNNNSGE